VYPAPADTLDASHLRLGSQATAGPLLLVVLDGVYAQQAAPLSWFPLLAVAVALLLSLAAWVEGAASARAGRRLSVLAVVSFWALCAPALSQRPALAFVLFLSGAGLIAWTRLERLFRPGVLGGRAPRIAALEATSLVQGAAITGLLSWVMAVPGGLAQGPLGWGGAYGALALAMALGLRWAWRTRQERPGRWRTLTEATVIGCAAAALLAVVGQDLSSIPLVLVLSVHGLTAWRQRHSVPWEAESWWEPVFHEPARMLVATFLGSGVVGGLILSLPVSTTRPVDLLDTVFTSFSAVCVTGLIVLDTPNDFSPFGQAVILLLIQVGGLGIMTFSTAALVLFGRRLSLRHEAAVSQLLSNEDRSNLHTAVRQVFLVTFAAESIGALILTALFTAGGEPLASASWRGAFTAVSAFCNAGFALQTDSLIPYQGSSTVLHVVAVLIVLGGIGPVTIAFIPRLLRRRTVPLQAKLVLVMTGCLLVLPAVFLALAEWNHGFTPVDGAADKLSNAWFQSVTLRTAGFNSVDLTALRPATLTVMMALMFVGGSPGSTAGGVKTTTAALAVLASWAAIRGRAHVEVFGVRVAQASIYKTAAVMTLGALGAITALVALMLTQDIAFKSALFEVVSALGTVGLSLGATGELDSVGKVLIIACMFAGRVGPLTLFVLLAQQGQRSAPWGRPEQDVAIG